MKKQDEKTESMNIVVAGVGGQGSLLAARILGSYAALSGYDCKLSEVHGMAQRGGSVVSYVRFGREIFSPLIDAGAADYVVAFEMLEAARNAFYLRPGGTLVVADKKTKPLGADVYPDEEVKKRIEAVPHVLVELAPVAALPGNTAVLGVFASHAGLDAGVMEKAIEKTVKPERLQENLEAFRWGYCYGRN